MLKLMILFQCELSTILFSSTSCVTISSCVVDVDGDVGFSAIGSNVVDCNDLVVVEVEVVDVVVETVVVVVVVVEVVVVVVVVVDEVVAVVVVVVIVVDEVVLTVVDFVAVVVFNVVEEGLAVVTPASKPWTEAGVIICRFSSENLFAERLRETVSAVRGRIIETAGTSFFSVTGLAVANASRHTSFKPTTNMLKLAQDLGLQSQSRV